MHAQDAAPAAAAQTHHRNGNRRMDAFGIGAPWIGALALAALLAGAGAGGSVWLALAEMDARARGQAARSLDEALDLMRVAEQAAGLSSSAAELESAGTAQRRLTAHNTLRQRTQQLGTALDGLPRAWQAELRFAAMAIRAEADDLNAAVERRLAVQRSLQALTEQVAVRSETLAAALAASRTSPPDGDALRRIDDSRQTVALRLLAGMTATLEAASARVDFRQAAGALLDALSDLPIDAASPRRADAARQLVALGMDEQNVFDLRQEHEALTARAAGIATLLRDTATDLALRAGRGALALRDGLRDRDASFHRSAAELSAAPAGVGLVAGLAVLAAGLGIARARAPRPAQPQPDPARPGPAERSGAGPETPPLRVLLAEDEPVSQQAAAILLRRAGHKVTVAGDGRAALAAAARERYDLVLMDMQMPGMDGVEATRRIRALPDGAGSAAAGPRIIALTASALPDAAERCRAAGADAVLEKPLRLSALDALLDRLSTGSAMESAEAGVPATAGLPVFDEDAIRQMREHLPAERVATLVTNTLVTLRGYHAALGQAWSAGDRATAGAMAHKIAGVAGIYGCMALRGAAQALERALDSGEGDPDALHRALDAAVPPALAALDRWSGG
ncbi:CheY-like chemotaxis protein [Azospirillum sp. OGB3]|uniref:response regulator n=1 Tax=Azospirillum sp. OGB3 TaxID=2587012 RepID=UPI00160646D6|nr:response regulator [Azospirillum sp. OGB3]MBB3263401.1 CheY-like chemotaxis protein [Azospirillum sp. OGB3]